MLFLMAGCDRDGGDTPEPTPSPVCVPNEELGNSDCFAEDLFISCNRYFCGATFPDIVVDFVFPNMDPDCEVINCETIECEFNTFTDLTFFGGPEGTVIRNGDGEESELENCSEILP